MKRSLLALAMVAGFIAIAIPARAQTGSIQGACVDVQGKPIDNAVVHFQSKDTGLKRDIKTNKKGEYFSLGMQPGTYDVVLTKDGKELNKVNGYRMSLGENTLDFKLDALTAQAMAAEAQGAPPPSRSQNAPPAKLTEEQRKAMAERQAEIEKAAKENTNIKQLNTVMAEAKAAGDAGNFDQAIASLTQATASNPQYPQPYAMLASYHMDAAPKSADAAGRTDHYNKAADAFNHAIEVCKQNPQGGAGGCKNVGSYYNNLGKALASSGKAKEAIAAYDAAAAADPPNAGQYYYNEGAVLTNTGKTDEANAAFDKAIAANPQKAEPYYQKGVNLLAKATIKDGKMVAPPEAEKSLQKYLELDPNGSFSQSAKELLAQLGSSVQTTYGTRSATKKK
jgi:tetratricopeptide (TPR) repeat protein